MEVSLNRPTVREAVGVFHDADTFYEAIDELQASGFDSAQLSLMAGQHAVEEKLGHALEKVNEAEDDPTVPRVAYMQPEAIGGAKGAIIGSLMYVGAVAAVGAVVASGGALAAAIPVAVAAGGAGGAIGAILGRFLDRHHANYLQQQLDHGGLLLWVRTWNAEQEKKACEILSKHSGEDIHVHEIPAMEPEEEEEEAEPKRGT